MELGIKQFNAQENLSLCEFCINNKHHKTKFPKTPTTRASELLELVHYDICGPLHLPYTHLVAIISSLTWRNKVNGFCHQNDFIIDCYEHNFHKFLTRCQTLESVHQHLVWSNLINLVFMNLLCFELVLKMSYTFGNVNPYSMIMWNYHSTFH